MCVLREKKKRKYGLNIKTAFTHGHHIINFQLNFFLCFFPAIHFGLFFIFFSVILFNIFNHNDFDVHTQSVVQTAQVVIIAFIYVWFSLAKRNFSFSYKFLEVPFQVAFHWYRTVRTVFIDIFYFVVKKQAWIPVVCRRFTIGRRNQT